MTYFSSSDPLPDTPGRTTEYDLVAKGRTLLQCREVYDLTHFFKMDLHLMQSISRSPRYQQFYIPKGNGDRRLIETPVPSLKKMQQRLAAHLQGVYRMVLPAASYGFIQAVAEDREPRDIYTNALRHCRSKHLLSLDLSDFFHSISELMVRLVFRTDPFAMTKNAAQSLSGICTFQGRLPMGAPSSPVLSNLVCVNMDKQLQKLADEKGWVYTRFVDDMSFSGPDEFSDKDLQALSKVIEKQGFRINEDKLRRERIKDEPEITGLTIRQGKPDVREQYIKDIEKDIEIFHELTSARLAERDIFPGDVIYAFRQSIWGQINFVKFVRGEDHPSYFKLKNKFLPKDR